MNEKQSLQQSLNKFNLSKRQQAALLLCNYIPFVHLLLIIGTIFIPWETLAWRIGAGIAELYLIPPLLARFLLKRWPMKNENIPMPSRDYFVWWAMLNLQVIFCRIPFLEEFMRLIPGAYSAWLRLWGSRIGSFTYWAPGLRILDRSFLDIGSGVVFGAGVRLNPHVIAPNNEGEMELFLAPIRIGDRAFIGGYALLTAGTQIADDETTRACLISPPFSQWKDGKRINKSTTPHKYKMGVECR
ncbi:MAG: hypothetical protein JXR40_06960 [Pontiellaceae bacterium]|nr:hypothetical protein [Pontiellaceae bacterium]